MKIKTKLKACVVCILSVATGTQAAITAQAGVFAANPQTITFSARVAESLSVTITNNLSATGNPGSLLTNSFGIDVVTNSSAGYIASMYSASTDVNNVGGVYTSLYNSGKTSSIPTLTSASVAKTSFPTNQWGYSLDDSTYYQMKTSDNPITIASANTGYGGSKTVFFGVKADMSKTAGNYSNNVTVNVVSPLSAGVQNVNDDPLKPTVPSSPNSPSQDTTITDNSATYVSNSSASGYGNSVYVNPSNNNQTQIISGNYTAPLGVTESTYYTTSETTGGSSMMTGLLVASATAAVSGGLFFLLSRSRDNDEGEDY